MEAVFRIFNTAGRIMEQRGMECWYADDDDGENLCIAFGENSEIIIPKDELLKDIK